MSIAVPIGFLLLLYKCSHTAIYVSSYCYISVHILLLTCPHTAIYVSSDPHVDSSPYLLPLTITIFMSAYCYICVLTLLCMCPQVLMSIALPICFLSFCVSDASSFFALLGALFTCFTGTKVQKDADDAPSSSPS
jgi:hypothetical protein